jgi:hypothetical protein
MVSELCAQLDIVIARLHKERATRDLHAEHARIARMYAWPDVAERTERVYELVMRTRRSPFGRMLRK